MAEGNRLINPVTGKQWDLNSLFEKLLEMQEALLQSQERKITLTAQLRELERVARDHDDLRQEHDNQTALLADKTRENKYIHQELSRISSALSTKLMDIEEMKATIADLQHQLKSCQSERDLLAIMLTEAERENRNAQTSQPAAHAAGKASTGKPTSETAKDSGSGWKKILKGKT